MRRRSGWRWITSGGLWLALSGCAQVPLTHPPAPSVVPPLVQRGRVEAQIETLPSAPTDVPTSATDPFPPAQYRALTAADVRRLACAHAPGASLYRREAAAPHLRHHRPTVVSPAANLRQLALQCTAREIQNRAVGSALETYYRLAEAEGKTDLLDESIAQLEIAVRETRDMLQQKLKPPVDVEVWSRQLHQAQGDRLKAQQAIEELNSQLRRMLGNTTLSERDRIWNPEAYHVNDEPIDLEAAVALALSQRAELILWRSAIQTLSPQTIGVIEEVLQSSHPLIGQKAGGPLGKSLQALAGSRQHGRTQIELRRQQLTEWLSQREAAIAEEVRQAVTSMRYHGRVVAIAWQRERSHFQAVQDGRNRQQQGLTSFAELTQLNLEWLRARADVLQATLAWYIARVQVWQAQGLLADAEPMSCDTTTGPRYSGPPHFRTTSTVHCRWK